ncbi:translocation/assembly module TamB domain-containing protein [Thalassorhabdomicrobium marinisediminis]|uniref:Translocation/assembly module TamB n=1 Tax=Thalassorhabdomicrobium marinisediminis TaxID=2170577 RepID=A0A2T7FX36_9RHOB|nr:translocation/assembly module TamB domain-containing protein [Thalassorhabdomicrobium marinisediminis]PVA06742.1 translocation/assembly module TamB [Thalassorhabdomicrobium marinisediminis]
MRFLFVCILVLWSGAAAAQSNEDDRSFLTGLIEDTISNDDLTVRLINFRGALSSEATADSITLADPDGVWLQMDGLTLSWNRSALLGGRVEIETLEAERIELIRLPNLPESTVPTAEAQPFALPDLPVAVDIGSVIADEIILTEALLGEPVRARFSGALKLDHGVGSADIVLERIDSKEGRFVIDAAYSNADRDLALNLLMEEGEDGIAARLLNIPGRPSVRLSVQGDAPLDDFTGEIALATDGVDRVTGTVALSRPTGTVDQVFMVDLKGDLRPLLADQYDPFFGATTVLKAEGTQFGVGGLRLSNLTIAAEQVVLRGSATLDAQGWPEAIDLRGQLASSDNSRVLLPLSGAPTKVSGISLNVQYDASAGNEWTGAFDITSLEREGVSIDSLALSGGGEIVPGAGSTRGRFTADLNYAARGLKLDDPALTQAIGEDITGTIDLGRVEEEPFVINDLTLEGAGLSASGNAIVNGIEDRFSTQPQLSVEAEDFSRFSELSGLDLRGAGAITLKGSVQPFDGIFDLDLGLQTQDLAFGIDEVDPLLRGASTVSVKVTRDTTGTRIDALRVTSEGVRASGEATLTSGTATADLVAEITDLALITPELSGPATLDLDVATDEAGVITLDAAATAPRAEVSFQGTGTPMAKGYRVRGEGQADIDELRAYRTLIGQPVGGGVSVALDGTFLTESRSLTADVTAQTRDLSIGTAPVDRILAGLGRITAQVSLSDGERLRLDSLDVVFPNLTAQGNVTTSGADTRANLSLRLRDVGLLGADLNGPLVADLNAQQDGSGWQVSGDATGPANTNAQVSGRVSNSGTLDLGVTGSAPLAIANLYIAPRQVTGLAQFDLRVQGPPALQSVRGPVRISNARVSAPLLNQAIENLGGTILLAGGTARIDLAGQSAAGGDVTLSGPVDLAPPFQAALTARLGDIVLRDPELYRTTAQGEITVNGPLAGGAAIRGEVRLGQVDVQVPSTGVSALGSLPAVTHLGVPTDVRRTLQRARIGTTAAPRATIRSTGPDYPIDLLVSAPSRIFVRGRGLDAELGGQLRLTGTTGDIIPIGRFELIRGRLSILGQRFDLDQGYAQLQGDFSPYLRLVATTESPSGVLVRIVIEGPADELDVRFESSPELPQDEVLAQLLFGRDLSSITPLQAVQLASAVATLAGSGNGGVLNSVREGLDLDDLDLVTDESGNIGVRAGKYLSENVYTDVTVGADGTSEINLNIDINRNVTARGTVAADGETSVGIFYERDY